MEYSRSLFDHLHWGLPRRLSWDEYDEGDNNNDDDVLPSSLKSSLSFILRHFLSCWWLWRSWFRLKFDKEKNTHLDTVKVNSASSPDRSHEESSRQNDHDHHVHHRHSHHYHRKKSSSPDQELAHPTPDYWTVLNHWPHLKGSLHWWLWCQWQFWWLWSWSSNDT